MKSAMISCLLLALLFSYNTVAQTCLQQFNKAIELYQKKDIRGAVQLAEESLPKCKQEYGYYSEGYLAVLQLMSGLYNVSGEETKKKQIYLQLLEVIKEVKGVLNEDYCIYLNNLAGIYEREGAFAQTEPLYNQAEDIFKKLKGENSADYGTILFNYGSMYLTWGKYDKAEPLLLKAYQIRKKLASGDDEEIASSLNNLGLMYKRMGFYNKAEEYYRQAMEMRKRVLGIGHPDYAVSLNNMAMLYEEMGEYGRQELLLLDAIEILKKKNGENNGTHATFISNLGLLYSLLGNFEKAKPLLIKAVQIQKNIADENNPDYIRTLNNLALYYSQVGENEQAESLYLETLRLNKKVLGEESIYYATNLMNLGDVYMSMQQYEKSVTYGQLAKQLFFKLNGATHPDYARAVNNLATSLEMWGKYDESEKLFLESVQLRKNIYGEQHPEYAITIANLATLYTLKKSYKQADELFVKSIRIFKNEFKRAFAFMTGKEAEAYLQKQKNIELFLASFVKEYPEGKTSEELLDFYLLIKGALLQNNQQLTNAATFSRDTVVQNTWQQYKALQSRLNAAYQQPQVNNREQIKQWELEANTLEKKLVGMLPNFKKSIDGMNITWQKVQAGLKTNEAAIEFFNLHILNGRLTDSVVYAAFLIKPGDVRPQFIQLASEKEITTLLTIGNTAQSVNQQYRGSSDEENNTINFHQSAYALLWRPLETHLLKTKRIYLSPSGLLYRVSFAAITLPGGGSLVEQYDLRYVSGLRELIQQKINKNTASSFTVFGGIDYNKEPIPVASQSKVSSTTTPVPTAAGGKGEWAFLPGTLQEAKALELLAKQLKLPVNLFTGSAASEEMIRQTGLSSTTKQAVLHIATHGFSFPEVKSKTVASFPITTTKTFYKEADDPLLRSGLVFAGANQYWVKGTAYPGKQDGILTAREITEFDLSSFNLVTLSACETGLGEIKGSEGVFGLQRAFKMAGVSNLIISLWQVPDRETSEFMKEFYRLWITEKTDIHEAFRSTQQKMSKQYTPYHWGAFLLVE